MANLLSELERFEEEMRALGAESTEAVPPPARLVAQLPIPPQPPLPPQPPGPLSAGPQVRRQSPEDAWNFPAFLIFTPICR